MMHKKSLYLFTVMVGFFANSLVFAAKVPVGTKLADRQELVRNIGSEPESLDPALAESVSANTIIFDLFEGLTTTDENGKVIAGAAESWKQIDATTWVFHLRKNGKWSNGQPVVAGDFVYAWQRFIDPKTASPYASTFGNFILYGKEITQGKKPPSDLGIKARDAYTLEIKTPYPVLFMPSLLANPQLAPLPKKVIDQFAKDWTKPGKIVSNGAYSLKEWQVNSKIVIEKNAHYWDTKNVYLTKVTFLPIEDTNTDVKLYESGQNDWVYILPPGTFDKYSAQYPKDIRNFTYLGLRYYSLNNKDSLMKDVRVRKALSMVIDRDILSKKILADGQNPAYSVIVSGTSGADVSTYDWVKWPMSKRVEEAKKLLVQAGVQPGTKLKLTYNTSDYHKKMAIFAAAEWKSKLGLSTELESMEFKVLLKKRHDGDYQIARNGWSADYDDATTFLALVQCDNDQNDNKNCNPKAEALIKEGSLSTDAAKRKQLFTQAVKMIMDDYPMIPLLQYTAPRLVKSYVGGYSHGSLDRHLAKNMYIMRH